MKAFRKTGLFVMLVLLLSMTMVLPVSAAASEKILCGKLIEGSAFSDSDWHTAVCVEEEEGLFIYCVSPPPQQTSYDNYAFYCTNNAGESMLFHVEKNDGSEAMQGVFRIAVKEEGFATNEDHETINAKDYVFPRMALIEKGETVYFVCLEEEKADESVFVIEQTVVTSVRNGVLTTEDKLERKPEHNVFSVIFNDNGDVVGFCTEETASDDGITFVWIAVAGLAVALAVLLVCVKSKKKKMVPQHNGSDTLLEDDSTTLDSYTQLNEFSMVANKALVLKCYGGYLNGRMFQIPPEGISIGRGPDNTIQYPGQTPGISRYHVRLFWQNGQLMLMDVGSSNGTYVNRVGRISVNHPIVLNPGDVFYLGEKLNGFEISFQ